MKMELLKGIKNIIFDLGGVIINLDYWLTINEFRTLGLTNDEKVYSQFNQLPWFDKYDTGRISSDDFITELGKMLYPGTSREQIVHAWNAMLLDFPIERAKLLQDLKKHYRLFLLSNTNDLHVEYYLPRIRDWYGEEGLGKFFENQYYSHLIGMRKPDKETFEFVLRENNLKASETFFIDDTQQHVEGARNAGIRAYHLQSPETITDLFQNFHQLSQ